MAALAQSVEHWIVIPGVTGSIPVCRPKLSQEKPAFWRVFRFQGLCDPGLNWGGGFAVLTSMACGRTYAARLRFSQSVAGLPARHGREAGSELPLAGSAHPLLAWVGKRPVLRFGRQHRVAACCRLADQSPYPCEWCAPAGGKRCRGVCRAKPRCVAACSSANFACFRRSDGAQVYAGRCSP